MLSSNAFFILFFVCLEQRFNLAITLHFLFAGLLLSAEDCFQEFVVLLAFVSSLSECRFLLFL